MGKIEKILEILKSYNYLGEKILPNSTILIAKAPHIAKEAWLHTIYPAISELDIKRISKKTSKHMPIDYENFLKCSNGLNVFNTTFCLFGMRSNYQRDIQNVWQPFDIIAPNTKEKPKNLKNDSFIIGYYDWDGSYLYIDSITNKVFLCSNDNSTSLYEWVNFEVMLDSEIKRLSKLFDKKGQEINSDISTLPI